MNQSLEAIAANWHTSLKPYLGLLSGTALPARMGCLHFTCMLTSIAAYMFANSLCNIEFFLFIVEASLHVQNQGVGGRKREGGEEGGGERGEEGKRGVEMGHLYKHS